MSCGLKGSSSVQCSILPSCILQTTNCWSVPLTLTCETKPTHTELVLAAVGMRLKHTESTQGSEDDLEMTRAACLMTTRRSRISGCAVLLGLTSVAQNAMVVWMDAR